MPGSMTKFIAPALEEAAQRSIGDRLGLCYSPDFVALGSVVADVRRPDLILIGESDPFAGERLAGIYKEVVENLPEIHRMNFMNAELCKLAVNTFVTARISFANMIGEICDLLPSANAEVVLRAAGADSRIGHKYLRAATGYGGPCFPRDNLAFASMGKNIGVSCDLVDATHATNERQARRLLEAVKSRAQRGAEVAVLGMSYKPGTAVVEASQGVALARALLESGFDVVITDPMSATAAASLIGKNVRIASSAAEAVSRAQVIVIATPWPQFCGLRESISVRCNEGVVVIDPWRLFRPGDLPPAAVHVSLGNRTIAADGS
jgi:UDPglucose 6-dehydrogenase